MADANQSLNAELVQATVSATMDALIKSGAVRTFKDKKKRVNWERLLVYEYVNNIYATIPHWFRIEVGALPPGENNMFYSRTRRWADCIVREEKDILIIEGKMKANPDVAAQLQNYKLLFPQTPLFQKYKELPIRLMLLCAMIDDQTRAFVKSAGIEVIVYRPANFDEWYKQVIEKGTGTAERT